MCSNHNQDLAVVVYRVWGGLMRSGGGSVAVDTSGRRTTPPPYDMMEDGDREANAPRLADNASVDEIADAALECL